MRGRKGFLTCGIEERWGGVGRRGTQSQGDWIINSLLRQCAKLNFGALNPHGVSGLTQAGLSQAAAWALTGRRTPLWKWGLSLLREESVGSARTRPDSCQRAGLVNLARAGCGCWGEASRLLDPAPILILSFQEISLTPQAAFLVEYPLFCSILV